MNDPHPTAYEQQAGRILELLKAGHPVDYITAHVPWSRYDIVQAAQRAGGTYERGVDAFRFPKPGDPQPPRPLAKKRKRRPHRAPAPARRPINDQPFAVERCPPEPSPAPPTAPSSAPELIAAGKGRSATYQQRLDAVGATTRDIRTWARENGVACPATGRFIPSTVLDAYQEAHP